MNALVRLSPGKYRLTLEDFVRLDEAGAFGTDRTELLDGDIIIMNAEYRPHARIAGELSFRLRQALRALGSELEVMTASVALSEHDMPLPDIVLTREPIGEGPIPLSSVALIVEVSSSTLVRDIRDKQTIYARAGVPEYWIIDVNGRVINHMWLPTGDAYVERRKITFREPVSAATIEGLSVATDGL